MKFALWVMGLVVLSGCAGTGSPRGYGSVQVGSTPYVLPAPEDTPEGADVNYRHKFHMLHAKPKTFGQPSVLGLAEYETQRKLTGVVYTHLYIPRSDFAIGKRHDDERWYRIDLKSGQTTPYPFADMGYVSAGTAASAPGRYVGVDPGERGRQSATLLDEAGHVVVRLDDLRRGSLGEVRNTHIIRSKTQPLDYLGDGAYVAHFDPAQGDDFSLVYNDQGDAISPPFPPIKSMDATWEQPKFHGNATHRMSLLPVELPRSMASLGVEREFYWPLMPDGSVLPKPEGLIGLEPLEWGNHKGRGWYAWKVWWMTADGPTFAMQHDFEINLPTLLATRDGKMYEQIEWDEIAQAQGETFKTIPRLVAKLPEAKWHNGWVALDRTPHGFMEVYTGPMSKDGVKGINDGIRVGHMYAAYEARKKAYDQYQAKVEAKRQAELAAAAERKKVWDQKHAEFQKLLAAGDVQGAEAAAWALGSKYAAQVANRYPDRVSVSAMSAARSESGLMSQRRLWDRRIKAKQGSAARQYYSRGSGGASSSSTPNSYIAGNAAGDAAVRAAQARTAQRLAEQAFETRINYINGNQSWYME